MLRNTQLKVKLIRFFLLKASHRNALSNSKNHTTQSKANKLFYGYLSVKMLKPDVTVIHSTSLSL